MSETNKKIKITEIEEIKYQADMIAGLSTVFALLLSFTKEDEHLRGGLNCLMNEANRLQNNCDNLLEKVCNCNNV